jgi:hypothetical protein
VYEITVLGGLGPVLRSALAPCRALAPGYDTIMRVNAHEGEDLLELVRRLESRGLEVANVSLVA